MTTQKHERIIGDTLRKLNLLVVFNGDQVDLSAYNSVKWEMEKDDGTVVTAPTVTGITIHPTQAFTVDATTNHLKCVAHGVRHGQKVVLASSVALPSPAAGSTNYFACDVSPDRLKVEAYPGAGSIAFTDIGTGAHTFYIVGSVQYQFLSTEVDELGFFRAWISLVSTTVDTYPDDEYGIPIEIKAKGN